MRIKPFFVFVFFICSFNSFAQSEKAFGSGIKSYLAVIKTKESKHKGVLLRVDSQKFVILSDDKYQEINTADIKSIKLRVVKPSYEVQSYIFKYIKTDKTDKKDKYHINQQGKRVDEWGREEPSFGEEVGGAVMGAVFGVVLEGATNLVVGTLHNINPNIAHYKFKNGFDYNQMEELSYFSTYYQTNPNILAESQKIKKITAGFKP